LPFEAKKVIWSYSNYHRYKLFTRILIERQSSVTADREYVEFKRVKTMKVEVRIVNEETVGLPAVNGHAAGIDVGSTEMWVTYTNLEGQTCQFMTGCCTDELSGLVEHLFNEGVTDVAMESTGIYGDNLRSMLEDRGIKTIIINPSLYRKPEVKTDGKDSIWLHQHHSVDLFRPSHIAPDYWREVREYIQERELIVRQKGVVLVKIQRQLDLMNIKLSHFISDIEGVSAMRVLHAIASGVTEPEKLLSLMDTFRFKADRDTLLKSLKGNYRHGLVNVLREKLKEYDFYVSQIKQYDKYLAGSLEKIKMLQAQQTAAESGEGKKEGQEVESKKKRRESQKKSRKNELTFNAASTLKEIAGIDLTQVEGLDVKTILTVLSVTGTDMSKWRNAEAFVSWLCLAPRPKISNSRLKGYDRRKTTNPATQALRLAARALHGSKGRLGQLYRRMHNRKGPKAAIKSVARHLGVLIYTLVRKQVEYDDSYYQKDIERQKERNEAKLHKLAKMYGYEVVKIA
jgi:transposase